MSACRVLFSFRVLSPVAAHMRYIFSDMLIRISTIFWGHHNTSSIVIVLLCRSAKKTYIKKRRTCNNKTKKPLNNAIDIKKIERSFE